MIRKMLSKLLRLRPAAEPIQRVEVDKGFIDSCMGMGEGYPRLDGEKVNEYIAKRYSDAEWAGAWTAASKHWLDRIAEVVEEEYAVGESKHLIVMGHPEGDLRSFMKTGDWAFEEISQLVGDLVPRSWYGKVPVLILQSRENYYDYTGWYDPEEGYLATSSGMFLHTSPPHIAINSYLAGTTTLIHELMHGFLAALPLPAWVSEGLAQHAEQLVRGPYLVDKESHRRHVRYWWRKGLKGFWDGSAFRDPKGSGAAYSLAIILLQNLMATKRRQLPAFILNVKREDFGEAAAQEHLGMSLAEIAATCLGDGEEPARESEEWE